MVFSDYFSDCKHDNVMMDGRPIYPEMYHPVRSNRNRSFTGPAKHSRRSVHPVKYYFIDFGLSHRFKSREARRWMLPQGGGDRTVPEYKNGDDVPHDPFPTDIYCLGNLIRERFLNVS